MQVLQLDEGIVISKSKYVIDLVKRFHMEDCKPCPTSFQYGVKLTTQCISSLMNATLYGKLIGIFLCLTHRKPRIPLVVHIASRYMQASKESHLLATKRILRYVRIMPQFDL
jgi:hypothetical protein